jgi:hypothetical protein
MHKKLLETEKISEKELQREKKSTWQKWEFVEK